MSSPNTKRRGAATLLAALLLPMIGLAGELAIGTSMPMADHKMTNVDSKSVSLADIKGDKGTVVAFWCNHCPWVVKWRSRFVEIADEYASQGFGFIAINSNDPGKVEGDSLEAMKQYAKDYSYSFPYVVDESSKLAKAYGATKTPHIYVFDANNKLVYVGAIDDNAHDAAGVQKPYLKNTLSAIASGEPVPEANTKALGCGIKWYK